MKKRRYIFSELVALCKEIHRLWYTANDPNSAKDRVDELEQLLSHIPKDDVSIVRQEGLAWLHQLKGNIRAAVRYRKKEIKQMEQLQAYVAEALVAGRYRPGQAAYALKGRGLACLRSRRKILESLEEGSIQPR